ncbi:hypothetical protein BofuT4_P019630.1 [Botrytis cinerea T4]|uniref:Uncharacterized protein n=1 Tax=Botryotinia fuckeliana (strain T4) TaxID=999810 RepID=G2YIX0_BOTF4|nr:hypothetical protein BofuT4_P019630.1 [Botrytis cinerea T4]
MGTPNERQDVTSFALPVRDSAVTIVESSLKSHQESYSTTPTTKCQISDSAIHIKVDNINHEDNNENVNENPGTRSKTPPARPFLNCNVHAARNLGTDADNRLREETHHLRHENLFTHDASANHRIDTASTEE